MTFADIENRRLMAVDFMSAEIDEALNLEEELDLEDFDLDEHFRTMDIERLRLCIRGKYDFEEGETLAAFDYVSDDRQNLCDLTVMYIRSLDEFRNMSNLDDISEFVIDTSEYLNHSSAEVLNIHAQIIGKVIVCM